MSHIGVIDTASFVREDHTAHGLHLNFRGKRRLTHVIAERVGDGHVQTVSSTPVITHARASPSFSLKSKAQRCLTYIKCNYLGSKVHSKSVDSPITLNIFHQNIRGLRNKCDELIYSLEMDGIYLHILCLSEHHMVEQDLLHLTLAGYLLGSSFCRLKLQTGGVCIFVRKDQCFNKIDISLHCKEQDLEICANKNM
jgi:hypothetical protein